MVRKCRYVDNITAFIHSRSPPFTSKVPQLSTGQRKKASGFFVRTHTLQDELPTKGEFMRASRSPLSWFCRQTEINSRRGHLANRTRIPGLVHVQHLTLSLRISYRTHVCPTSVQACGRVMEMSQLSVTIYSFQNPVQDEAKNRSTAGFPAQTDTVNALPRRPTF